MNIIVEMRFGSHLYGTATPESDLDLKAVYVPEAPDILLQRVRATFSSSTQTEPGVRNQAGDIDREIFSLQRFLDLLAEGQPMALDMLFAPDSALTQPPAPIWQEIRAAAPRLVSRRSSNFVRYCRQQANKYGIKGSRVASARQVLRILAAAEATHGTTARLATIEPALTAFVEAHENAALVDMPTPGGQLVRTWKCAARGCRSAAR